MTTSSLNSQTTWAPHSVRRNEVLHLLPDLNRILVAHADLRQAFPRICRKLHRVLSYKHAAITVYDAEAARLRLYTEHSPFGEPLPEEIQFSLEKTPDGEVYRSRRPVLVDDLRSPQFACESTLELLRHGRRSGCWVPLRTADTIIGTLSITTGRPGAYRAEDADLLNEIAGQISLALADQIRTEQLQKLRQQLDEQIHDWSRSFRDIAATAACGVVQWGADGVISDANEVFLRMVGRNLDDIRRSLNCSDLTSQDGYLESRLHAEEELRDHGSFESFQQEYQHPDGTRVPVLVSTGLLNQKRPPWIVMIVDLRDVSARLEVPASVPTARWPHESKMLVADSPAMRQMVRELEEVAPTETSVLLLGETGTGKEVLAHAVCEMSRRRHRPFVKVDCAAVPAESLESELFGYEKGAFAGAQCRKVGSIELANQGTLFLDEIGDIPLSLQSRLLRLLQEQEYQRLGGNQTIKVDIRLITATNRNLAEMVLKNQFRRDLFYRLSVFPVRVPPLRERPESIAAFAHFFVKKFTRRLNRPALTISTRIMGMLERWQWPGNIRELADLIERGVILSPGPELRINLEELHATPAPPPARHTLRDIEREHISRILHETNGVVGGLRGAASILGIKRTTLQYRMKKLEIPRW